MYPSQISQTRNRPVEEKLSEYGIWAFESRHGETFSMTTTVHRFPKLLLIREGSGQIEGDWGKWTCKTGDCILISAGMRHRIVDLANHPIALYGLGVATRLLACVPDVLEHLPISVLENEQLKSVEVEHRLRRILFLGGHSHAASRLACVASSLELFAETMMAIRSNKSQATLGQQVAVDSDPALLSYITWLDHHFFEPITLDHAARSAGMSRRYFTTCFKKHVGTTWLEYVHRLRVRHAIELLQNTDRKITSVAFQCGFDDLTTFYRVVGKITGKRPTELRNCK